MSTHQIGSLFEERFTR